MAEGMKERLTMGAVPFLGALIIKFLRLTMRIEYRGFESYRRHVADGGRFILAFWHGRLLMMPYSYIGRGGVTILVSQHRDGEMIARTVKRFGIESERGSSTRGWFGGIKGLLRAVRSGRDLAITPDGPKGPRYVAQMGAIQLARATGLPIIPVTFGASKKKPLAAGTPS